MTIRTLTDAILGIDIGGTKTAFGFVSLKGDLLGSARMLTEASQSSGPFFTRLHAAVEQLQAELPTPIHLQGVGVGAPNANFFTGEMVNPPNLPWGVVPVTKILSDSFQVPCWLTNDAKAAALGEFIFGDAKGLQNFIVITIGTGLGSGIISNGQLVYGHDGFAGEIGHTIYDRQGRECGCGRRGCLETYVSGPGLKRTAFELLATKRTASSLRNQAFESLTAKNIYEAAQKGDPIALEAFDYTAHVLAAKLADTIAHVSPSHIFFCGGLTQAGELLFDPLRRYTETCLLDVYQGKVHLLPSALPPGHAAILGAAALFVSKGETRSCNPPLNTSSHSTTSNSQRLSSSF